MYSLLKIPFFSMLLFVSSESNNPGITCAMNFTDNDNHCSNDSTCPTWFTCDARKRCQCNRGHTTAIACDNQAQVSTILNCNCVTFDSESKSTYAGPCFYNCLISRSIPYQVLPRYPKTLINKSSCTPFHRTGVLCGDCEEGHSPLIFSYDLMMLCGVSRWT
jgi:hypothetical protein